MVSRALARKNGDSVMTEADQRLMKVDCFTCYGAWLVSGALAKGKTAMGFVCGTETEH